MDSRFFLTAALNTNKKPTCKMSCDKKPDHQLFGKPPSSHGSYRDFSMESEDGMVLDESFPVKLHYMLADIERDGKEHIVGWHGHGR
jgi:hypothetical protein